MEGNGYSTDGIEVLEFDESVKRWLDMYFGTGRGSPDLATRVLSGVLAHALHPAARLAAAHTLRATAEVTGDLSFVVTDDQADALAGSGSVRLGYNGSLLGPVRWISAAAAAVSSRTVVEVWRDGRGLCQELAGLHPIAEPRDIHPPTGVGTRVSFELNNAYFGPGQVIAANLASLDLHGPDCVDPAGPGHVTVIDMRGREEPIVIPYR
ncbi:hypothetical protein [Polymorphospora rubra]|uniref:Uncharacterized protein n=1 Tax=Polymorphospora rubra TaxID=338584 RepID=A0A810N7P3_9ACTN|nr:hypothetical protein [Polymorphospora rubra]BCJ69416.1 hypothetical protein Prubr_64370 [Polymorphospora rubra]